MSRWTRALQEDMITSIEPKGRAGTGTRTGRCATRVDFKLSTRHPGLHWGFGLKLTLSHMRSQVLPSGVLGCASRLRHLPIVLLHKTSHGPHLHMFQPSSSISYLATRRCRYLDPPPGHPSCNLLPSYNFLPSHKFLQVSSYKCPSSCTAFQQCAPFNQRVLIS